MKKIILSVLCCILLFNCQRTSSDNDKKERNNHDSLTNNSTDMDTLFEQSERTYEKIDKEEFISLKRKYGEKQTLEDGTIIERLSFPHPLFKEKGVQEVIITPLGFETFKIYYYNGILASEGQSFRGANYGIYSKYDSLGYLTERVDCDINYLPIDKMVEKFKEQTGFDLYTAQKDKKKCEVAEVFKNSYLNRTYYTIHVSFEISNPFQANPTDYYYLDGESGILIFHHKHAQDSKVKPILTEDGENYTYPPCTTHDQVFEQHLDSLYQKNKKEGIKSWFNKDNYKETTLSKDNTNKSKNGNSWILDV